MNRDLGKKIPITVVIPTLNEEANIAKCLCAVADFGEIVVLDSGSVDQTVNIVKNYNVVLKTFKWNGCYPKKRNWYLLNFKPKYEWVLFLDADEIVTKKFRDEITKKICSKDINGFILSYNIFFLGKKMNFGIKQRKLSLFRFGSGLYEKIDDNRWSNLDMEVHEHPIISGKIGKIEARIDHIDRADISKMYSRHLEYAKWEVERSSVIKRKENASYTIRQKIKYRNFDKFYFSYMYFLVDYVLLGRFIDGYSGLKYSLLKFWYFNEIKRILDDK